MPRGRRRDLATKFTLGAEPAENTRLNKNNPCNPWFKKVDLTLSSLRALWLIIKIICVNPCQSVVAFPHLKCLQISAAPV